MKSGKQKLQKAQHDQIKDIKWKMLKGKPITFLERNLLNIYNKKQKKS